MMYRIGISCVGGGVGQSVVNSCRLSRLPIKTIGLDTNPFAYGAYDCDTFDYVPSVSVDNYIDSLIDKCEKYQIDLIIPGLDDEILMYAQNREKFKEAGVLPLVSGAELIRLCRDKEKMSLELNRIANVFVRSYDKNTLLKGDGDEEVVYPLIAKPRGGSASKGIEIIQNKHDLEKLNGDHIIQELAIPAEDDPNYEYYLKQIHNNRNPQVSEISIQVVTDKNGTLLGRMASYNKLKDGIPIEIVPVEDKGIWDVVDELMPHFLRLGLRGPLNIQGRLTEKGLKIFEMNPRFTGITGLRAVLGFNEVESCIANWLDIGRDDISLTLNRHRFGIRQTADKAVPLERSKKVRDLNLKINSKSEESPKTLLITGADGFLGQNIISSMLNEQNFTIWAYGPEMERLTSLFSQEKIRLFDKADYESGKLSMGNTDILLHCGFAGLRDNEEKIADSLAFTHNLFTRAATHHVPAIINISSKCIYGSVQTPFPDEEAPAAPRTSYAQAHYAAELMLQSMNKINNQVKATSLRLATLTGGCPELTNTDPVARLVQKAINGGEVTIDSEAPLLEWLDIRDAVGAIKSLLEIPSDRWRPVYDVGSYKKYSVEEITKIIVDRVGSPGNRDDPETVLEKEPEPALINEDSRFNRDTGWKPAYRLNDSIDSLYKYYQPRGKMMN